MAVELRIPAPRTAFPSSCADRAVDNGCVEVRTATAGLRRTRSGAARSAFVLALVLAGCADTEFLRRTCPTPPDPKHAAERPAPTAAYQVGCPDVLEITFLDHPAWDAVAVIDVDGRLPLERPGAVRADGRTLTEIRDELAALAGCSPERVTVALAAARSARVVVYGPIRGRARIVPYQGPEPVIDFLKRIGGLPPGSKLNQVYVVRPNVAAAMRPQVFSVDVAAVLIDGNQRTNVTLRGDDQIYVGETKLSSLSRLMPDWLGTVYRRVTGLLPDDWWPFSKSRSLVE
ncbi:polysaccharide export protein wza : Polysaccharide export protein Wza OS=Haematobacter missouriensis GN=CG51_11265 PE=4 SV=1: Poly_export [Gemmata massiliana]|uniref:Polysaccharide export protein N-terminal domain-containing protein n=1 Tax=Gemmata massiliana TaxID=1210884 RepID=A0A6P2DER0_9BACT|nr:polysaccharide export protein wza : Polysaccharide export protein Wza OS=Haematobacter missouriensis GN=CG51_11265 PE=4 SV=1: Poly_export [Gemmata massiliana]